MMTKDQNNGPSPPVGRDDETHRPTEEQPNDPHNPEPVPVPPDYDQPTAPVREPDQPPAAGDPGPAEPTRIV